MANLHYILESLGFQPIGAWCKDGKVYHVSDGVEILLARWYDGPDACGYWSRENVRAKSSHLLITPILARRYEK